MLLLAGFATAGSLTPPGSPSSTMNTLGELFNSVAGTFDSTAILADQNGSLIQHLKYIEANMSSGAGVSSDSLDFDEFVDLMTLDADTNIASGGFVLTTDADVGIGTTNPITQLHVAGSVPAAATGSVATGDAPTSVYIQGRYAYVVHVGDDTLQIFDVSNPAAPVSVGTAATGSSPDGVYIQGRYAYVLNASDGTLQVFDVSNPAAPVSVGTSPQVGVGGLVGLYVQGRYAYAVDLGGTLEIFDVSNPAAPVSVGTAATGNIPRDLYVQGRYAYVVNANVDTLQIFDVSNPAAPVSVGTATTESAPLNLYVQGRYAYVVNAGGDTLQIFDVSNPAAPTAVGSVTTGSFPIHLHVQGRYAYVINQAGDSLQVFDVGGSYIQQFEAGGLETGTLMTRSNLHVGNDADVRGGMVIGRGLQVTGPFSVTSSVSEYKTFTINPDGSASISGNFGPTTTNAYDLGSSTVRWRDLYLASGSLHIGISGDEAVIDYNVNDDYLSFKPDGSTTRMAVLDGGNVGIGTTTPGFKLEIGTPGDINLASSGAGFRIGGVVVLHNKGANNIFVGENAGSAITGGSSNTAVGGAALLSNTTGSDNTALGAAALLGNITGDGNTGVGRLALVSLDGGDYNTAVGYSALGAALTGDFNVAVGVNALVNNSGDRNVAIGESPMGANGPGSENVAIGTQTLSSNSDGNYNIAIGSFALNQSQNTDYNIAIGSFALRNILSGNDNIAIGASAGYSLFNSDSSGNVFLGRRAGYNEHDSDTLWIENSTVASSSALIYGEFDTNYLSFGATVSISGAVFMSGLSATGAGDDFVCRVPGTGEIRFGANCTPSSIRFKKNVQDLGHGLDWVRALRPVTFDWKHNGAPSLGFIAEEVNEVTPLLALYQDGKVFSVNYQIMTAVLAKAIQEQQGAIEALQAGHTLDESSLITRLITYLRDAIVSVRTLVAGEVKTERICVGETCVTEEQFKAVFGAHIPEASPTATPEPTPVEETPEATPETTVEPTPDVTPEPTPEPVETAPETPTEPSEPLTTEDAEI